MKIKLNSYKLLFHFLDLLSNSKWLHKFVINRKVYLGASIISLSMVGNSCSSDKAETKNSIDKKDSTIDNLNGNEIPKNKKDSISRKTIKSKSSDNQINIVVSCYNNLTKKIIHKVDTDKVIKIKNKVENDTIENTTCYIGYEPMAEFPGGDEARIKYLLSNTVKPKGTDSISGTVYVEFVVEKTGEITNIKVKKGVHPLLDAEAIRVVKNMPKWNPEIHNGSPVNTKFIMPFKFTSNK